RVQWRQLFRLGPDEQGFEHARHLHRSRPGLLAVAEVPHGQPHGSHRFTQLVLGNVKLPELAQRPDLKLVAAPLEAKLLQPVDRLRTGDLVSLELPQRPLERRTRGNRPEPRLLKLREGLQGLLLPVEGIFSQRADKPQLGCHRRIQSG
ncbi:MAG: hypothetical protein ACK6A4_04420, partial [Alphaproteobacteria bacterium]